MSLRLITALVLLSSAALFLSSSPVSALQREAVVCVSAITGTDSELADAVTETLVTDLARSPNLSVIDGRDAKTQIGAQYRVVGRCLKLDSKLLVSVRVLYADSGRTVPGAAEITSGSRAEVLTLVDKLAERIAGKIGGHTLAAPGDLPHDRAPADLKDPAADRGDSRAAPPQDAPPTQSLSDPAMPGSVRQNAPSADDDRDFHPERAPRRDPAPEEPSESHRKARFTGLIIDARGLGIERSMSPKIRREDGSVIWAGEEANPDDAIEKGIVAYVHRMSEAEDHPRAGAHPLVIRAIDRHDNAFHSDPLLADEDADYVLRAARRDGFLKEFNVVLLID